jgi:TRAP-type C4-dicarboxylate transport system permease small subunit
MELRKKVDKIIGWALVVIMGAMVLNVLWQVFTRFIGIPSSFTDELARYLMIWLGLLGAAYVSGKKMHVAIDLISSKLSEKGKRILSSSISTIVAIFSLLALVIGGSRLVYITFDLGQNSPALQVPLALVYLIIPISGLLIIFYKISDIFKKQ